GVSGLEIDHAGNAIRMAARHRAQLLARERMSHQNGTLQPQGIDHLQDVITEKIRAVFSSLKPGVTEPATGDAVDVVVIRQLRREVIEFMRGTSARRQEDDRSAGAAPIEHLESDVPFHLDESDSGRRWITSGLHRL